MPAIQNRKSVVSALQSLNAPPHIVFPLLCPVREYDWIEDWSCKIISSRSGFAEPNCVFTTFRDYGHSEATEEVWMITRYEPERAIEFVKFCAGLYVIKYDIYLSAKGIDGTRALWTQARIPLSEKGEKITESTDNDVFQAMIERLEKKLNHYVETGAKLM